ncbi:HET-domain-containing protein [Apiospora kogelbergensis]|uniref:HET-domain-containing protein n=1 Tax=Apiospora kogelbergensis TaxID=1337665 RepID=A0AAW0QHY6_9PEZI
MVGSQLKAGLPHAYNPLDTRREQIRLLHLLPGSWEDPVSCTTSTVYLSDSTVFESLSYAWGDPSITKDVFLDGHTIAVTVNLFAALRRLRSRTISRCLWADALCINQTDLEEKSRQVLLMGKVYSGATRGLMWLGEYSEQLSDMGAANRGFLQNGIPEAKAVEAFDWLRRLAGNAEDSKSASDIDYELTRRPATSSCASSLQMLLALPWWNRMWTLQEVVLPRNVSFVCGSSEITLAEMDRAQENYSEHEMMAALPPYPEVHGSAIFALDRLSVCVMVIAQLREAGDRRDVVHALLSCKDRQATDPRDKIYAVLGLFPQVARLIEVDYGKDASQVSTELLLCLIRLDGDLQALVCVAVTPKNSSLPSWVPNWCYMQEHNMPGGEVGLLNEYHESCVAKLTKAQFFTPRPGVLAILGLPIGRVVALQPMHATSSQAPSKGLAESFKDWIENSPADSVQCTEACIAIIGYMINRMRNLLHHNATVFMTNQGHIGYACHDVQIDDIVHVLFGGISLLRYEQHTALKSSCALGNTSLFLTATYMVSWTGKP